MARTPKDELKLAAMIAAAKAKGLKGGIAAIYADGAVCAVGAKHLAAGKTLAQLKKMSVEHSYRGGEIYMYEGNDANVGTFPHHEGGSAFDIGSAFSQAMEP